MSKKTRGWSDVWLEIEELSQISIGEQIETAGWSHRDRCRVSATVSRCIEGFDVLLDFGDETKLRRVFSQPAYAKDFLRYELGVA
jgi:hypothetical protein